MPRGKEQKERSGKRRGKKGYAEIILALLAPAVTVVSVSSCTLRRTRVLYTDLLPAPTLRHRLIYIYLDFGPSRSYTGEKSLPRPGLCAIVNLSSRAPKCVRRPREEEEEEA